VPADDEGAGLADLLVAALQDLDEDVRLELALGEADERERGERLPAHGVDVRESVRRRDPAERARVIDDRGEEVDRLDEGAPLVEPIDGGVRRVLDADEEIGVRDRRKLREDLPQDLGRDLRRSPSAGDDLGEPLAFLEPPHTG
jgi:hypothetical protein